MVIFHSMAKFFIMSYQNTKKTRQRQILCASIVKTTC